MAKVNKLTLRDNIKEYHQTKEEIVAHLDSIKEISKGRTVRLFKVAQGFHGKDHEKAAQRFSEACTAEETWLKSNEAGAMKVDKIDRAWTQAKSNCKRALELGLDLTKYETESALRKDLIKLRNTNGDGEGTEDGGKAVTEELGSHLQTEVVKYLNQLKDIRENFSEERAIDVVRAAIEQASKILAELMPVKPEAPEVDDTAVDKVA